VGDQGSEAERSGFEVTGFSKNAHDGVASIASRDPALMPYFLRNGAGIVTRPRVENSTL